MDVDPTKTVHAIKEAIVVQWLIWGIFYLRLTLRTDSDLFFLCPRRDSPIDLRTESDQNRPQCLFPKIVLFIRTELRLQGTFPPIGGHRGFDRTPYGG